MMTHASKKGSGVSRSNSKRFKSVSVSVIESFHLKLIPRIAEV